MIWTTLTVTENNIETELIISELPWIALYAQLLKILISSWNSEVLFVEPEVLRKNKTSSLVEMGSVCFFFFFFVVVGEQLPGALQRHPLIWSMYRWTLPLDSNTESLWTVVVFLWFDNDENCYCFFKQSIKKGGQNGFFFSSGFPKITSRSAFPPVIICVVGKLRLTYLK